MTASYVTAADTFDGWREELLTGTTPELWSVGDGELSRIETGPGLVTLIGGAPGSGKTALTMQIVADVLRRNSTLRCLVCNVEMPPSVLLDRQLSRLSGIDATTIRRRTFSHQHADRLAEGLKKLEAVADRLAFVRPPFDLSNVAASADDFGARLLVLDYIQRIKPPGDHADHRGGVNETMGFLRNFADAGIALIVVAAVSRGKDSKGRTTYESLNLASFRESSELEFGADDAFILMPEPKSAGVMVLRHLKSRHGETRDIRLTFDRPHQRFASIDTAAGTPTPPGPLASTLAGLWDETPAAEGGDA